jgi:hypothetical protein
MVGDCNSLNILVCLCTVISCIEIFDHPVCISIYDFWNLLKITLLVMFQRDQGGALVIRRNNAWTQIGVGCLNPPAGCGSGQPDGFTRVTAFLTWIRDTTGVGV